MRIDSSLQAPALPAPNIAARRRIFRWRDWNWVPLAISATLLAYGVAWQRGAYMDDYALRDGARDVITGIPRPLSDPQRLPEFPIRSLNWLLTIAYADRIPAHEGAARFLAALAVAGNAALLGGLIFRLLRSRLAALLGGGLFLCPFYAQEALLWAAACGYLAATALVLTALHFLLSGLHAQRHQALWLGSGLLLTIVSAFLIEQPFIMLIVFPLLALCAAGTRQPKGSRSPRVVFFRATGLTCLAGLIVLLTMLGAGRNSVQSRGGLAANPRLVAEQSVEFVRRIGWLTNSDWSRAVVKEVFRIGLRMQTRQTNAAIFGTACAASFVLLLATWRARAADYDAPFRWGGLCLVAAVAGFFLTLLLPGVLIQGKIIEGRMLYVPLAFLGLGIGALVWLLIKWTRAYWLEWMSLAIAGSLTWLCATCVLGYAAAYAQRYRLDQAQLAMMKTTLAGAPLPANTLLIPVAHDERLWPERGILSSFVNGVLEVQWSARTELARLLSRRDFCVLVTNRWDGMTFNVGGATDNPDALQMNGQTLPTAQTLLLTCRDEHAWVIRRLVLRDAAGVENVFTFPLAEELSRRGAPTMEAWVHRNEMEQEFHCLASGSGYASE